MTSLPPELIVIRPYEPSIDKEFVYANWLRKYKEQSYFAKRIRNVIFFKEHHKIIDHIMSKPSTTVVVASSKDEPDVNAGFMVYEKTAEIPTIHFVYVKEVYKNMGVATTLLATQSIDPNHLKFTHWTFVMNDLIQKYPGMLYNPYAL